MILIKQVYDLQGEQVDVSIASSDEQVIDGKGLTLLPGLIDPHVHFRVPGQDYKEDWTHAARAAIRGGFTTVFDMPNNEPACISHERLIAKKALIEEQLQAADVPLRYQLYIGADKLHFDEIHKVKNDVIGIKVFMGSSTGELLMDDDSSLHAIFALAAAHDLLVAVHAEDECMIHERSQLFACEDSFATHSKIRTPEVALAAVELAISLSRMYGTRLYILHVSTQQEITAIARAKARGVPVFAETTPHHLFLNTEAYANLQGKAQVNPPLRDPLHQPVLLQAIRDGIIDTIGSDHAPHTLVEKQQAYGKAPSGMPGIETNLPLLLTACQRGDLQLSDVVRLTHDRPREIFGLPQRNDDAVLVDLNLTREICESELATKCKWSAFADQALTGWPVYTIVRGRVFDLR